MMFSFEEAGATNISFHPEATLHVDRTIQHIRDAGCKPGLVFNPATSLNWLDYVIDKIDTILLMSVNPGFGGQKFIPGAIEKVQKLRALAAEDIAVVVASSDGIELEGLCDRVLIFSRGWIAKTLEGLRVVAALNPLK